MKVKQNNLKMVKQLQDLNNFVSKKLKGDAHSERTFNGAIPQHISKQIQNRHKNNSITPSNINNDNSVNISHPFDYQERAKTDINFYRENEELKTYQNFENGLKEEFEVNKQMIIKETIKSDEKSDKEQKYEDSSQIKFKLNPSPFKRREKSIDELIQNLESRIQEIEAEENKLLQKSKYQQNKIKQKSKKTKKRKQKKARSHSPKEIPKQKIKQIATIQDHQSKNLIDKNKDNILARRASFKKPNKVSQTSDIKHGISKTEGDNKHLKIKTFVYNKDKKDIKLYSKPFVSSSKIKKKVKSKKIQALKERKKSIVKTQQKIYQRAAVVIQRWYRRIKQLRTYKEEEKKEISDKQSINPNTNTSPHNRDIQSIRNSEEGEVIEKRVIIDIHTDNKDENYQLDPSRKRSRHNFSFGNNARLEETPEDATISKDTDFERYKRKKRADRDYQFKKRGRNIFDTDKGEEAEEAFDYYDIKSFNEEYDIMDFDLKKKRKGKQYARTVNNEEEK